MAKRPLGIATFTSLMIASQVAIADEAPTQAYLTAGLAGVRTTWSGDYGGGTALQLGIRANDYVGFYFLPRLGYAAVDERMTTFVSAGIKVWPTGRSYAVEPYLRLAYAHQHEETMVIVRDDPISALFGIGDGIRHRGGLEGAIGAEFPLAAYERIGIFAALESTTTWYYDTRGPHWYFGATGALGLSYDL